MVDGRVEGTRVRVGFVVVDSECSLRGGKH